MSVRNLAQAAAIEGVQVYEQSARFRSGFDEQPEPEVNTSPDVSLLVRVFGSERLELRYRMEYVTPEAFLVSDISIAYTLSDLEANPTEEEVELMAKSSGLLHLWPFLRESLFTSATRLGVEAPLLPVILPGVGVGISLNRVEADSSAADS